MHSALIGTETLSLVIYRGEPDQNISFEVLDAAPALEALCNRSLLPQFAVSVPDLPKQESPI